MRWPLAVIAALAATLLMTSVPAGAQTSGVTVDNDAGTTATATAGNGVDTVTVVGTPQTGELTPTATLLAAPNAPLTDPGAPVDTITAYSMPPSAAQPASSLPAPGPSGPLGGRAEPKKFPWWIFLIVGAGVWAASS